MPTRKTRGATRHPAVAAKLVAGRWALALSLSLSVPLAAAESCLSDSQPAIRVGERTFAELGGELVEITSPTTICASCHDGTVASTIVVQSRDEAGASRGLWASGFGGTSLDGKHPVEIPYPENAPGYVPRRALDERLRLQRGRITCVTCHGRPGNRRGFAVSLRGSRLCVSCHVK